MSGFVLDLFRPELLYSSILTLVDVPAFVTVRFSAGVHVSEPCLPSAFRLPVFITAVDPSLSFTEEPHIIPTRDFSTSQLREV